MHDSRLPTPLFNWFRGIVFRRDFSLKKPTFPNSDRRVCYVEIISNHTNLSNYCKISSFYTTVQVIYYSGTLILYWQLSFVWSNVGPVQCRLHNFLQSPTWCGTHRAHDQMNLFLTLPQWILFETTLKLFDMIRTSQSTLPFVEIENCPTISVSLAQRVDCW